MTRATVERTPRRCATCWLLLTLAAAAPLCACYGPERESVHFNSYLPDFSQQPRPWPGTPPDSRAQPPRRNWQDENKPGYLPPELRQRAAMVSSALRNEAAGKFGSAAVEWEHLYRMVRADPEPDFEGYKPPAQLQGLRERIMALQDWRSPAQTAPLRAVLRARDLLNAKQYRQAEAVLMPITGEPFLRHAQYLKVCVTFYTDSPSRSVHAYQALARSRPRDPLILYMIARSSFRPVALDEQRRDAAVYNPRIKYIPINKEIREDALRNALRGYEACTTADPRSPLGRDAEEMAAGCRYRLGEHTWPLLIYCRRLGELPPGEEDWRIWLSARYCFDEMSAAEHQAFQKLAVDDAPAACAYLDLLLHYGRPHSDTVHRLGLFALEVLRHNSAAPVSAGILARLAAVENRNNHPEHAERLARAALHRGATGLAMDESRWQLARALQASRKDAAALAEFDSLADRARVPAIRRGAREAAAVLWERRVNYVEALREYFALDYRPDYAYVLDCLASPRDLEAFLRRYPHHPQARLVRYSLGFRQLRSGDYAAAERTFACLGAWLADAEKVFPCKTADQEPRTPPLEAARILAAADRREREAKTAREKAQAAYDGASFLFHQRPLLFYNGALWRGERIWEFDIYSPYDIQTGNAEPSAREQALRDRYEEEHAALFHALRRFERVARDYPHMSEAPKALATAALCYLRLPAMGRYWVDRLGPDSEDRAAECYLRLLKLYPHDPLAKTAYAYVGNGEQE